MIGILDPCALIAFINEERGKGYEPVDDLITRAATGEVTLSISAVNLVEVYYCFIRQDGQETADAIMQAIDALPITIIETVSSAIRRDAARFKVLYAMSFADTFLCAAAKKLSATGCNNFFRANLKIIWYT
ncbi:hypothetical protein FACS1894200_12150 [Spirochaetia bacterium]|nr:hypothetical protein FACS1894200_12150 [Spirochaetia bacterium]